MLLHRAHNLLLLGFTLGCLTACVEPPTPPASSGKDMDNDPPDAMMPVDMEAPAPDMSEPRRDDILITYDPDIGVGLLDEGRTILVDAVYVDPDGSPLPDVVVELNVSDVTGVEVLTLEDNPDGRGKIMHTRSAGEAILTASANDLRIQKTIVVQETEVIFPADGLLPQIVAMRVGEEFDLGELFEATSALGWERSLEQWCDPYSVKLDGGPSSPGSNVASLEEQILRALEPGLARLSLECTLPGGQEADEVAWVRVDTERDISASSGHTCVILNAGASPAVLECWGENGFGQVGDGTRHDVDARTRVSLDPDDPRAATPRQVVAGARHTCAVDESGRLYCWGDNSSKQVAPMSDQPFVSSPNLISNEITRDRDFIKTCVGASSSCALSSRGEVFCWGGNDTFLFGDSSLVPRTTFKQVGDPNAIYHDLSCASAHRCLLDVEGNASCWGDNSRRQIRGGEDVVMVPEPLELQAPAIIERITTGEGATCVISSDDILHCGGASFLGAFERDEIYSIQNLLPFEESGMNDVRARSVSIGATHVCATDSLGDVYCWGESRHGAIGVSSDDPTMSFGEVITSPTRVPNNDGNGAPHEHLHVAAGHRHSCAITSSQDVYCWGDRARGRLANKQQGIRAPSSPLIFQDEIHADVDASVEHRLALGLDYSCIQSDPENMGDDPTVRCWGNGRFGSLDGAGESYPAPPGVRTVKVSGDLIPGGELSGGDRHVCTNNGLGPLSSLAPAYLCWGLNEALNAGMTQPIAPLNSANGLGEHALMGAAGRAHSCALLDDGKIDCWGEKALGQLGQNKYRDEVMAGNSQPVLEADEVEGLTLDVSQGASFGISARDDYTCAWGKDGQPGELRCWGLIPADLAMSGFDTIAWKSGKVLDLANGVFVYDAALGSRHLCAHVGDDASSGEIRCLGDDTFSQQGGGTFNPETMRSTLVLGVPVFDLVAGREHTCALVEGEFAPEVRCWGSNSHGQCGQFSPDRQSVLPGAEVVSTPTKVPIPDTYYIVSLQAGAYHTCALAFDDGATPGAKLFCWGDDSFGQSSATSLARDPFAPVKTESAPTN